MGSVLVYDFWTPPPVNFVHDHLFFTKFIMTLSGPSATNRTG